MMQTTSAVALLLTLLCGVRSFVGAQTQSGCGSSFTDTQVATLIASNINGAQGTATVALQMSPAGFMFRVVCLSSSGIRNQYRFVSIVAYYSVNGGTPQYGQFEFECSSPGTWSATSAILGQGLYNYQSLASNAPAITAMNTTACGYCLNSNYLSPPRLSDAVTHCNRESVILHNHSCLHKHLSGCH